ncbi:uncharacterized protein A1O5_11944 [Cladophialophora psammophila CBS 110553]|uniref:C2H2-type domain-containing protein n=1 Tax=Cladophialophora psammophila CBS 110553 TaxID=1182543 RepID=W9VZ86_9EURO|nr:uncharacterized protein A1O5_11944 [Cladophialophora psammophila CBS 110553]EXJ61152.1 hypothetical protein A1O5_11944 [Cladophialophora psammophila CBS 110553]
MQSSNLGLDFPRLPIPQSRAPYQRALAPLLQLPAKGGMDVSTLLNRRNHPEGSDELSRFQQSLQMDGEASYGMDQGPTLAHHSQSIQQSHVLPYNMMAAPQHSPQLYAPSSCMPGHDSQTTGSDGNLAPVKVKNETATKSFPCGTCSKGFARRSDLARHERIHSGDRPHVCDHPNCNKSFIQRSALTVHLRVHTGEKPHLCGNCGKPFSDSSSLARHRRTHSGKRPYKCEYANCQKTFTRRTTLTRHQNSHTGTLEEAAAEVNAKLAPALPQSQSVYGSTSAGSSRNSTASPADRTLSISPNSELPPIAIGIQRQGSDYGFLPQTHSLPPHMRSDFGQNSPRSTPPLTTHSLQNYTSAPQQRPTTSHPPAYGPPQPLEPPANGTASGSASPHLGALVWGSPGSGTLPTPSPLDNYGYPDPAYGGHSLYYPGSAIRRPQSTEPEDYGLRPRHGHMSHPVAIPGDWTSMPLALQDNRQERYVM